MQTMDLVKNNYIYYEKTGFDRYKVKLKNNFLSSDTNLTDKSLVLLISVGQQYHEGLKFISTIDKLNRAKISFCNIMVADTLQRHNPGNTHISTKNMGEEWLKRNMEYIKGLNCPYKISRWDDLLSHPIYKKHHRNLTDLYSQGLIKQAFNDTALKFISRNPSASLANCISYLFEECPIIMNMSALEGYDYIAYPQRISNAMKSVYDYFIKDYVKGKCQWLQIQFKRKNHP